MMSGATSIQGRKRRIWRAFVAETNGAAAVEFAFIAPIMLAFYFLTMEFSQAIETSRKLGRVAIQVGDLITQQPRMTPSELGAIMAISESTLQPYDRSEPSIAVTAIRITDDETPKAVVVWWRCSAHCEGVRTEKPETETSVPEALKTPGAFLIRSEAVLGYQPIVTWSDAAKTVLGLAALDELTMGERYYQRPRTSLTIPCNEC